ncbi:MAG: cytochrome c3 family protein [Pseudomonadota bacterium]
MKILLRTIEPDSPLATERVLDVPVLKIGRGSDQDIVLGDLRLALAHAELLPHQGLLGSSVRLQAKARLGVKVNGTPQASHSLKAGDVLDFGRYSLTVGKPQPGFDLVLSVQERIAASAERSARKAAFKTTLADTGWSRRRLSWLLFLLAALTLLALPLLHHFQHPPAQVAAERSTVPDRHVKPDIVWNSGPLSNAHQMLSADCGVCHQEPFLRVQDASCKGCHADLGDHAMSRVVVQQHPFAEQQCTDCHREHNGAHGLIPTANAACTVCHADPADLPGKPGLATKDFSSAHPEFMLKLTRKAAVGAKEPFVWVEARQGTPEAKFEDTGLKFPHDLHLDTKGIDAPEGKRVLECAGCHTPTTDRASFLPVTMEAHCSDCHRLDFDPQHPDRLLPHGEPSGVVQSVQDHFARIALAGGVMTAGAPTEVRERRRPGETLAPNRAKAALAWADGEAQKTLADVFEKRSCYLCHAVTATGDTPRRWQIAPVAPTTQPAFTTLTFPHGAHATETCASCHASATSKHSEDVLLPDIHSCRDCHGDTGAMTETASPCQSCHVYHLEASATLSLSKPAAKKAP